jgi:hypothetical protein
MATTIKPWYKIKDDVEYSTDFKFFSENQIRIVRSGTKHIFCSRLEAKSFRITRAIFGNHTFSDAELIKASKEIHQEILDGKHCEGKFVD